MKNISLIELETWGSNIREFDYIYIVPTKQKYDGTNYNIGYYLGTIGNETKIIQSYDCGMSYIPNSIAGPKLQWDFECPFGRGGIKIWRMDRSKIKYNYGGNIY